MKKYLAVSLFALVALATVLCLDDLRQVYYRHQLRQMGVPAAFVEQANVAPIAPELIRALSIEYFTHLLVEDRGVPLSFVQQSGAVVQDVHAVDRVAVEYFAQAVIDRGVPTEFLVQVGKDQLISATAAYGITIKCFAENLANRGVAPDTIALSRNLLLDSASADQVADQYFTKVLVADGVDPTFLKQLGIMLLSDEIADQARRFYEDELALEAERQALLEELEALEQAVAAEQVAQIGFFNEQLQQEYDAQAAKLRQLAAEQLENTVSEIEQRMRECIMIGFLPVVGNVRDICDAITGTDSCTNQQLTVVERLINLAAIGGIFDALDKVSDLFRGFRRAGNVADAVKDINRAEEVDALMDAARAVGRSDGLENLIDVVRDLERADDVQTLTRAAKALGRSQEFDALVDAVKELEKAGDVRALARAIESLQGVEEYSDLVDSARSIQRLSDISVLQSAQRYLETTQRAKQLSILEKVFRFSGLADDVSAAVKIVKKTNAFDHIAKYMEDADDYLNFVRHVSPGAGRSLWRKWTSEYLQRSKIYRPTLKTVGDCLAAPVIEELHEIWIVDLNDSNQRCSWETVANTFARHFSGYALKAFFEEKPSQSVIDEIEKLGGTVYWLPDNQP